MEELGTEQDDPIQFEVPLTVDGADIDAMGHVNNIVYLRWVQEAATAHWNSAATAEQRASYAWVVVRHEIDYLRPAMPGDALVARTHVGAVSGAKFDRHVEIWRPADNQLLARARTVWVAIDPDSGRPRRVGLDLTTRFHTAGET